LKVGGLKMKIRYKIVLMTTFAVLLMLLALIFIIQPYYAGWVTDEYVARLELQLNHVDFYMEEFVNSTKDDVDYLSKSRVLKVDQDQFTNYTSVTKDGFTFEPVQRELEIIQLFNEYIEAKEQIEFTYFGGQDGSFVMNEPLQTPGAPKESLFDFDPRQRPWYRDAIEANGETVLTEPYTAPSGYSFYLTAAKTVEDESGAILGVLGIDLNIRNLSQYLLNVRENQPGVFGMLQRDTMIKIYEGDVTLIESDPMLLGDVMFMTEDNLRYNTVVLNDETVILVSKKARNLDWYYYIAVPKSVVDALVKQSFQAIYIPVLAFFAVFMLGMIIFLQRVIMRPIVRLKDTTSEITETGNLAIKISGYGNDEVGVLADSFNRMMGELRKNKENLEELVEERTNELKEQQQFLENLINNSTAVIYVKDVDFRYLLVNDLWCGMFHKKAEDVYGKTSKEVFGHDTYTQPEGDLEVIRTKKPMSKEEFVEMEGVKREFIHVKFPLMGDDGNVTAVCNIATEITEYKKTQTDLAQKREQLNVLFDTMPIGVSMISATGQIKEANRVSEKMLGISSDEQRQLELASKEFRIIRSDGSNMPVEEYPASRVLMGESMVSNVEMGIIHDGEETTWISTTAAAIDKNSGGGVVVVFEDITEKRKAELDLVRAKDAAEEALRIKSDFLANMSHEIRTPMNAIIGLGALLEKTGLDVKQHDYVEKINRSAKNLLGIINDILDFSKIEAGKLSIESIGFSLDEVLGNISSVIGIKAFEKGIEFLIIKESEVPDSLIGDSLRLNQVLLNLSNNAVKFTENGQVSIRVSKLEETEYEIILRFTVKDSGIGMTREQTEALFQAFSQADMSITRKYGGTGLGLAISKNLIEMMQGHIFVESEHGEGSEFYFDIPFKYNPNAVRKSRIVPDFLHGLKIAVLEDNETALEVYDHYLKGLLHDAKLYNDPSIFINEYVPGVYDLIILDYQLKSSDGIMVWKEVKRISEQASIPSVILVTAYGREQVVDDAFAEGINTVLMKPLTQSSLYDGILTAVKGDRVIEVSKDWEMFIEEMAPYAGNRLLLVEDNPINQQVALENLESIGFTVEVADNGLEAVEMVDHSTELYDLILMDLQMPVMDGFTATEEIRSKHSVDKLPIIALSADVMKETLTRIGQIGIQAHVAKPIDLSELYTVMKRLLQPKKSSKGPRKNDEKIPVDFNELLPSFDVSDALQRLGGNKKLYVKLLKGFTKEYGEDLDVALEGCDQTSAIRYFHTLKGLAGNIGATSTQELAKTLELGHKSGEFNIENLAELEVFTDIKLQVESDVELMTDALSQVVSEDKKEVAHHDDEAYVKQLNTLVGLLDEYDMDSESVLNEMLADISSREGESVSKRLKTAIDAYEYEEALDHIRSILKGYESYE